MAVCGFSAFWDNFSAITQDVFSLINGKLFDS